MTLHGHHLIAGERSARQPHGFRARSPRTSQDLEPIYAEATHADVDRAASLAAEAFDDLRTRPAATLATLLETIAGNLGDVAEALITRASEETALGRDRLTGELGRTQNQLRLFAGLVRKGDWRDIRIDRAMPDRKPLPRPDLRRMLAPVGPVAVWAASNFPLAFSVAGGDTASALAAGNPVVVKAHPGHPGASEIAAEAITAAVRTCGLPPGTFSLLHGRTPDVSLALVRHPAIEAAGFTGSLTAGRRLYDAASTRPRPIPFFAEMGSTNPVFILPSALESRTDALAEGLFGSVTLGVGQFCTNPGVVAGLRAPAFDRLAAALRQRFGQGAAGSMLYAGIRERYDAGVALVSLMTGVTATVSSAAAAAEATEVRPTFFETDVARFLEEASLQEELFGPASILVSCGTTDDLLRVARSVEGSLTATIHGTDEDLVAHRSLIALLETRVGRLIVNGYPTGVEVSPAMQHGGPYPATTDVRFTSVGTAAIARFARPICYQNFPQALLPRELQNANELGILRLVDGEPTRAPIEP